MAFNPAPSTTFPAGYALASNTVSFNTADHATPCIPELTSAEANATSGDNRKIIYAFCEKFFQWYNGLASADRPARLTIARSTSDGTAGTFNRSYNFQFTIAATSTDVAPE